MPRVTKRKKKIEDVEANRERNRQAQHDFRLRRQAAEAATQRRLEHLENTIEEMSKVFIGFCDDMLSTKELASQPHLMARLQHSTTRVLALARSVSTTTKTSAARESEGDGNDIQDGARDEEKLPKMPSRRKTADSTLPQVSCQRPSVAVVGQAQMHTHEFDASSFAVQLVKATLSHASLALNGDIYIRAEDMERAFGSMLRIRTRQQLATSMRWMLGPGRDAMYQATGINWNPGSTRGAEGYSYSVLPHKHGHYSTSDADSSSDNFNDRPEQPEFLTALGVQEQLQSLGAKVLSPDTMELSISGSGSTGSDTRRPSSNFLAFPTANALGLAAPARLVLRLNTFLLATNLSHGAKCLGKGPVYPRHGIAKAIEASVILARGG
ncbi:hypothetical protein BGZ61DRAFT_508905 [Ilyonectria robusta]|uniref:uncharacterized protein n=1 Tax=Ilyonectria robusta TaxID=1079257 RepID=UPI001E8D508C|nr:uncharacterized protein BGZ61DRAFT_508905 [Ilyonectria robusta]KAH8672310.1 hypothetical protein BGZ61DRAFT_508905 [Ilyonectria robusta]